ncbi:MAG TPA: branched-chain amino acid ABC transporter permease, partial [Thermoplasmata archaeon]|nr:branched-chain amino acid ABC transporter permease [Thermoplasmata archaeon]
YVLGASGLSLTYGVKKFANFAHGDLMTVGAYLAFVATSYFQQSIVVGFIFAAIGVALLGVFLELAIFRRLDGRGEVAPLIASVGVALVLENVLNLTFGTSLQYLPVMIPQDFALGNTGLHLNAVKGIATGIIAVALMVCLHVLLNYTTLGKAMRACSDDLDLARASGINTRNIVMWTWALSGAFAAVAGVLLAIIVNLVPLLGFHVLLFIFAAVIIGGVGSPSGALFGGFLVGLIQVVSDVPLAWLANQGILLGGVAYEPAVAFIVMILVLLFLPDGIMGARRPSTRWRARLRSLKTRVLNRPQGAE